MTFGIFDFFILYFKNASFALKLLFLASKVKHRLFDFPKLKKNMFLNIEIRASENNP